MTVILSDKGQKKGKHSQKEKWFADNGYEIVPAPLPVGDYVLGTPAVMAVMERKARRGIAVRKMDFIGSYKVAIDTKRDMQELYQDIVSDHGRFRDECLLAQQNGIKLYILVENLDNIRTISDVKKWKNPRYIRYHQIKSLKERGKAKNAYLPKKPPMDSVALMKSITTMSGKYGVIFRFCNPCLAGITIAKILEYNEESLRRKEEQKENDALL